MRINRSIVAISLLISAFNYGKSSTDQIKELDNAAYLTLLELKRLGQEIKNLQSENMLTGLDKMDDLSPYFISELCYMVEQKLKEKGIDISRDALFAMVEKKEERKSISPHKKLIRETVKEISKSEQWIKKIEVLTNETSKLTRHVGHALLSEGTIECNLHETLFDDEENPYRLNMFKFSFLQSILEISLLKYLFDRYQSCITQLISISNELRTLKQEENR
jgi:hypothetical protein